MKSINIAVVLEIDMYCHNCETTHQSHHTNMLMFSMPDQFDMKPDEIMDEILPVATNAGFELNGKFDPEGLLLLIANTFAQGYGGTALVVTSDMTAALHIDCESEYAGEGESED